MTPEQATNLKAGDAVEYRVRGAVHRIHHAGGRPSAVVIRRISDAHGRQPLMLCALANVHVTPVIDPATAINAVILADWLDDHDHGGAATLMRRYFGPTVGLVEVVPAEGTERLLPTVLPLEANALTTGLAALAVAAESTTWGSNTLVESQNRPEVHEELSEHAKADREWGTY